MRHHDAATIRHGAIHARHHRAPHGLAGECPRAPELVPERELRRRWTAAPLAPPALPGSGGTRARRRLAPRAPLLQDTQRERLMLSQRRIHFKRATGARLARAPRPRGPERARAEEPPLARCGRRERARGPAPRGLGERAERNRTAAEPQREPRVARVLGEAGLGAPAPARVHRQLDRAILRAERKASLRVVPRREDTDGAGADDEPHAREIALRESPGEHTAVRRVVGDTRARAPAIARALATIFCKPRPRLGRASDHEAATPARREQARNERAARERGAHASAREFIRTLAQGAARATAAEAHALRTSRATARLARGPHGDLELLIPQRVRRLERVVALPRLRRRLGKLGE